MNCTLEAMALPSTCLENHWRIRLGSGTFLRSKRIVLTCYVVTTTTNAEVEVKTSHRTDFLENNSSPVTWIKKDIFDHNWPK